MFGQFEIVLSLVTKARTKILQNVKIYILDGKLKNDYNSTIGFGL